MHILVPIYPGGKALLLSLLLASSQIFAANWPQWRGPNRDGHAPGGQTLIKHLPPEPKVSWKIKAGPGLASPIVAGEWVYLFEGADGRETLRAVDRVTAREKWRTPVDQTFHDNQGPDGPRCTPLADGDRVYAVSCRGTLVCLNTANGQKIWGVNFTNDFGAVFIGETGTAPGATRHGNNGTPLIVGEKLYAVAGGTNGSSVVCLDKHTGKLIWKSQSDPAAYAPPALARLAGANHLVCFTAEALIGLNPEDGDLWWRVPIKTAFGRHVTAPVWNDDIAVVSSHQAGMIGTKISRDGNAYKSEQAWLSKSSAMNYSSPVAVGKHLYGLGPKKNLICVEITTGKEAWSKEGYFHTSVDKTYAGFLVLGENILCLTDGGQLILFRANPEKFEEKATSQVCGLNWCNPAYADGKLYLRDGLSQAGGSWICFDLTSNSN